VAPTLLSTLLLLLLGALLARLTARSLTRWAVPAIVLELFIGAVLGNSILPFARIQPLAGLTELGVLSLFFQVGLEVSGDLRHSRPRAVLRTVLLSALTPLLAWWPLQQQLGMTTATTVLMLAVLSATGTGVTLRTLADAGALNSPSGRLLVGVSVLDDLPAIGLLTLALAFGAHGGADTSVAGLRLPLGLALVLLSLPLSRWWRRSHGPWQPGVLGVLLLLIGCSWVGEATQLTSLLGALWGGVLLNRLAALGTGEPAERHLREQLRVLTDVFLPIYFISVGLRLDGASLLQPQAWGLALLLTVLGVACKLLCGFGIRDADTAAGVDRQVVMFGLIPRGLPGLVFASMALDTGLISPTLFSSLVLMVTATTVLGLLLLGRRLQQIEAPVGSEAEAGQQSRVV
jgi:Kef-type K+ transport system membrane component KefB